MRRFNAFLSFFSFEFSFPPASRPVLFSAFEKRIFERATSEINIRPVVCVIFQSGISDIFFEFSKDAGLFHSAADYSR